MISALLKETNVPPGREVTTKVVELESIRGIAALFIVIFHIPAWNAALYNLKTVRSGHVMVDLFFVLSGYVIYNAYADRITTKEELIRFQFLRFGRLYPVHLFFALMFLAIETAKYFAVNKFGVESPNSTPFFENSLQAFVEQLFLVQALGFSTHASTFNGPAWSISVEFYTYMVFGLIILNSYRSRTRVFGLIVVFSAVCIYWSFDAMLFRCLAGFFTGALLALSTANTNKTLPSESPFVPIVLLALVMQFTPEDNRPLNLLQPLIVAFISALLIFTIVKSNGGLIQRILKNALFTRLGSLSYAIYMSHFMVLWISSRLVRLLFANPEVRINGVMTPQLSLSQAAWFYPAILGAVIVASLATHVVIERPFRKKSRDFVCRAYGRNDAKDGQLTLP